VEHWLNGERVVEYELHSPAWRQLFEGSKYRDWPGYAQAPRGHIGLQDHESPVWYRNIKLRPVGEGP
jgi:cytochrome c